MSKNLFVVGDSWYTPENQEKKVTCTGLNCSPRKDIQIPFGGRVMLSAIDEHGEWAPN